MSSVNGGRTCPEPRSRVGGGCGQASVSTSPHQAVRSPVGTSPAGGALATDPVSMAEPAIDRAWAWAAWWEVRSVLVGVADECAADAWVE